MARVKKHKKHLWIGVLLLGCIVIIGGWLMSSYLCNQNLAQLKPTQLNLLYESQNELIVYRDSYNDQMAYSAESICNVLKIEEWQMKQNIEHHDTFITVMFFEDSYIKIYENDTAFASHMTDTASYQLPKGTYDKLTNHIEN